MTISVFIHSELIGKHYVKISDDAHEAIAKSVGHISDDSYIAAYAGGAREGITPQIVAAIRDKLRRQGRIKSDKYRRQYTRGGK